MALFGKNKQVSELEARVAYLEQNATPEYRAVERMSAEIVSLKQEIDGLSSRKATETAELAAIAERRDSLEAEVAELSLQVVSLEDEVLLQEFGLYEPRYDFTSIDQYKERLSAIREEQKASIRQANADAKNSGWTVNGNKAQGRKLATDLTKSLVRSFNGESDEIIRKVKFSNIDASVKAIEKTASAVNKLGTVVGVSIHDDLVKLKQQEAYLAFEYARFKEDEKERLRELKAQEREAKKLEKEIEAERKKLEKEQQQYSRALAEIVAKLEGASPEDVEALEAKKAEIEANLNEVSKAVADVDYREANQKAGYVYIISNIGSFGEDVYKIGMTRRLDPMERIKELGDASVPFEFDVHALIFTDDAPGLEAALHRTFEKRKLNLVNHRREFFKCSLDEIKSAILANYDKTVEFVSIPDAEQYRISEKLRAEM